MINTKHRHYMNSTAFFPPVRDLFHTACSIRILHNAYRKEDKLSIHSYKILRHLIHQWRYGTNMTKPPRLIDPLQNLGEAVLSGLWRALTPFKSVHHHPKSQARKHRAWKTWCFGRLFTTEVCPKLRQASRSGDCTSFGDSLSDPSQDDKTHPVIFKLFGQKSWRDAPYSASQTGNIKSCWAPEMLKGPSTCFQQDCVSLAPQWSGVPTSPSTISQKVPAGTTNLG